MKQLIDLHVIFVVFFQVEATIMFNDVFEVLVRYMCSCVASLAEGRRVKSQSGEIKIAREFYESF